MANSLRPRPGRGQGQNLDPFEVVLVTTRAQRDRFLQESDPVIVHQGIELVDQTLKRLAELQKSIGEIRKEIGHHEQSLRQAKPKGKPAENEVREINGKSYIFINGRFYPIKEEPAENEEKEQPPT